MTETKIETKKRTKTDLPADDEYECEFDDERGGRRSRP